MRCAEASSDSAYLLTGMIYCASCGARYFPHKRPNGTVVYSCHSRAKKNKKMVKDPRCKSPHYPVSDLDSMVEAEVLRLAENPGLVDEIIKKRTAKNGGSSSGAGGMDKIRILDAEIDRLMDLYQHNDLVDVEEIAARIQRAHEKRMEVSPGLKFDTGRWLNAEGSKLLLRDVRHGWSSTELKGRRALLMQLIDRIHIDKSGVVIDWSF